MLNTRPKIAITDDTTIMRCRLLIKLIEMAGGIAELIPTKRGKETSLEQHVAHIKQRLASCQAVILPGNKYDIHPSHYGEDVIHPETLKRLSTSANDVRYETEATMVHYAMEKQLPLLAICGGFQVANVALGGSLVQHIPDKVGHEAHRDGAVSDLSDADNQSFEASFESFILHNQGKQIFSASHSFAVKPNNQIASLYEHQNLDHIGELNLHHQGMFIENLSPNIEAIGLAEDGVVEAAMIKNHPFALLFQPHIECNVGGIAFAAIKALLKAIKT